MRYLECIQGVGGAIRACHKELGVSVGEFALHHADEIGVFVLLNDLFPLLRIVHTAAVVERDVDRVFDPAHLLKLELWANIQVDIPVLAVQHLVW